MATENPLIPQSSDSIPTDFSGAADSSSQAASAVGVSSGRKQGRGGMVFDTTPAPAADAAAAAPSPPDLKPLSTSIEPANPVEAFIGEMALAIQQGPFHRFFQQLGKAATDETQTEPPSQPAMTGPPQTYIFSAGETLPLGVRATARLEARKTNRHIQPGDQILVARVFSAKGVPFAELVEGGYVPLVHPRTGKPIVTKAADDGSSGGGGTSALATATPARGSQLLALADADDAAATQHAHQLVDLAATAAAASSSSQPQQRATLPLERVKTITRGCLALNGECTSSKRSRARAANQLGFMVKESELRVKELEALFKVQRAAWAELGQSLGVPLEPTNGVGGRSGDTPVSSNSLLSGSSTAITLASAASPPHAAVGRVPEQLLAHVGACGESAAGELRHSRAFTAALKLAHARAEGADATVAATASSAAANDALAVAALEPKKAEEDNTSKSGNNIEPAKAASAATAAAASAERVAQELGEAQETVEGLLKDPAAKLPPGVKHALLGLNAALQELSQLAQPLPGALNDAAAAVVSASSRSGAAGGAATAAAGITPSELAAAPAAPLPPAPSGTDPAASAVVKEFIVMENACAAPSPSSLSAATAAAQAPAEVPFVATTGTAASADAVTKVEASASAALVEPPTVAEGGGTAVEVESSSKSSDTGAQKKKKKSKKQSKKSENSESTTLETSVAAVAIVTKVQYNSDSDAEGGFEDF